MAAVQSAAVRPRFLPSRLEHRWSRSTPADAREWCAYPPRLSASPQQCLVASTVTTRLNEPEVILLVEVVGFPEQVFLAVESLVDT